MSKKICKRPGCNKILPKRRGKYCSNNCQKKDLYIRKKQTYIDNSVKWKKKNPKRNREIYLKANRKFRKEKRERFNELMRNNYHKNKQKWI